MNIPLLVGTLVVVIILALAVKIVRQYERAVIFRLGKLLGEKGPGIFVIIPFVDRLVKVDFTDSCKAIVEVEDYEAATALLAQTTLRDVLGQNELDSILSERDRLNKKVQEILDIATDPWGMQVVIVTMRDVALPENMLRAIARQAEAEREKRARIILAEGEYQASERMSEAAALYEKTPVALKLREFQTLTEIAKEKNLIVVSTGAGAVASGEIGATAGLTKAFTEK
jgi:regulator of protease activity HflC (stomatin/prohibitin superfamily)